VDRVMKDIVTQCGDKFEMDEFVPLLQSNMPFRNPSVRQLMLSWISILLKVPEVQMVSHVHRYLDGLFNMLGDQVRDVRHNADAVLSHLLMAVKSNNHENTLKIISGTAGILVKSCFATDPCARLTALCWLDEFVILQMNVSTADLEVTGNSLTEVKLAEVAERKRDSSQHRLSEGWMASLPELVDGMLHCIDDREEEIATMAIELNSDLLDMVQTLEDFVPADTLLDRMIKSMEERESMAVRKTCLQWICMLLAHSPAQMLRRATLQRLFDPILDTLVLPDEEVVLAALQVLANIMSGRSGDEHRLEDEDSGGDLFSAVTQRLLRLFAVERGILETRGRLMIRKLCSHLDPRQFYVTVAHAIKQEKDLELAQQLVQTFSWVLLTAIETKILREELLQTAPLDSPGQAGQVKGLFSELLVAWFHNPVSALALCLWAQQDDLALELTARLATFEPTVDLFKQLDQLVQLLESPIFSRLRLRLLKPSRHPALVKCLLGLAMILPQAGAFNLLQDRVHVFQSGMLLEKTAAGRPESNACGDGLWAGGRGTDMGSLLDRFDARPRQSLQASGGSGTGGSLSGEPEPELRCEGSLGKCPQ